MNVGMKGCRIVDADQGRGKGRGSPGAGVGLRDAPRPQLLGHDPQVRRDLGRAGHGLGGISLIEAQPLGIKRRRGQAKKAGPQNGNEKTTRHYFFRSTMYSDSSKRAVLAGTSG